MADKSMARRDQEAGNTPHAKANKILLAKSLYPAAPKKKDRKFPGGGKFTNGALGKTVGSNSLPKR